MEHETPNVETMGGCMLAGDLIVAKLAGNENVLLVGDTRVGKSSLFNYLRGLSLRARETKDCDIELISDYADQNNTKYTFESVTLVPNKQQVNARGKQYNLVDMPGFFDQNRNFVGVFGVSYMLEKVMSSIKNVKWILVVQHPRFSMSQIQQKLKPYLGFISMFNFTELVRNTNLVQQIASATSIIVSKSQQRFEFYYKKLEAIIKFLQQSQTKKQLSKERKIILVILKSIYNKKRIDLFKKLKADQVLQSSEMLGKLNDASRQWKSYSFQKSLAMQHIIQLPFAVQYNLLSDANKQKYSKYVQGLSKKFEKSIDLLRKFIDRAIKNWYSKTEIDYSSEYSILEDIIQDHPYGSIDLMLQDMNLKMPQLSENITVRIDLMMKLVQIHDQISQLEDQVYGVEKEYQKIRKIRYIIQKILIIFRETFCQNQTVVPFVTFICVFRRYLIEAEKVNLIDKNSCANTPHLLQGCLKKIFPFQKPAMISQFLQKFEPLKEQRRKFQQILQKANQSQDIPSANDIKIKQKQLQCMIKKAQSQNNKKDYKASLKTLIKGFQILIKCKQYFAISDQREAFDECYSFNLLLLFKRIAINYEGLNQWMKAIKIYQMFNMNSLAMHAYEKFIQVPKATKIKKFQDMLQYSKFLKNYHKKAELICLYEKMMDEFIYYPNIRNKIREMLKQALQQREEPDYYLQKLQNHQDQWDIQVDVLKEIIKQIQQVIQEDQDAQNEVQHDQFSDIESNQVQDQVQDKEATMLEQQQDDIDAFKKRKQDVTDQLVDRL